MASQSEVEAAINDMGFIEKIIANLERVNEDFTGFFFALKESENAASEVLQIRHNVALLNKLTEVIQPTSASEIISRAKSTN